MNNIIRSVFCEKVVFVHIIIRYKSVYNMENNILVPGTYCRIIIYIIVMHLYVISYTYIVMILLTSYTYSFTFNHSIYDTYLSI